MHSNKKLDVRVHHPIPILYQHHSSPFQVHNASSSNRVNCATQRDRYHAAHWNEVSRDRRDPRPAELLRRALDRLPWFRLVSSARVREPVARRSTFELRSALDRLRARGYGAPGHRRRRYQTFCPRGTISGGNWRCQNVLLGCCLRRGLQPAL